MNRGSDDEVRVGNVRFADQMAAAIRRAEPAPAVVVYANSTQAGHGGIYGDSKAAAAEILQSAANAVGAVFQNTLLPNLFGEHGRPFYNAVTATFCHLISQGEQPTVQQDKELTLLHAQDAADLLIEAGREIDGNARQVHETVSGLLRRLSGMASLYDHGQIPDLASKFDRDLFNTYRSYTFPAQTPIRLTRHEDARGSFCEIIRSHGGGGQSSFSTTVPGMTRGDHFHRRKMERFTVESGEAVIALRRLFHDEVFEFRVSGSGPVAVDMPTMWAHKITNVGNAELFTSFWSNEIFDPNFPDTIAEAV
nr:NAD-dependent epimerase/dehydratase family protein [Cryobacterium suzukii]